MSERMPFVDGSAIEGVIETTGYVPQFTETAPDVLGSPADDAASKEVDYTLDFAYDAGRSQIPFGD